eukprot:CAMPEP_0194483846 /NCGR_PEP_ID=MMETSP0253-20130528/5351_1 /TAXON_ID=2966 /ORGANISM="Noctiluca scintillans" /LENGTH=438 /DNA_ID=CAMNT_0039323561 /DNA_START=86 /DNA_END=1398 /DNA_ORIENTATION=-
MTEQAEKEQAVHFNLRTKHIQQLRKTMMCAFFLDGHCGKGSHCLYAHSIDEIRVKPDLSRTSMCRAFLSTGTCHDRTCTYAHSEEQLRTTKHFFKTKICRFATHRRCKLGVECRFAHSQEELASYSKNTSSSILHAVAPSEWEIPPTLMSKTHRGAGGRKSGDFNSVRTGNSCCSTEAEAFSDQSTRTDTNNTSSTPEASVDSGQEETMQAVRNPKVCTEERLPQGGTTLQITNVPVFLTQGAIVALFEDLLGSDNFDFFYCPWDPVAGCNLGYAIINFYSRSDATNFENVFRNGEVFAGVSKKMRLMPTALQGRAANIKHFSVFSLSNNPDPRFRPLSRAGPGEPLRPLSLITETAPAAFAREFSDFPSAEWNLSDPGTYQATQSHLQMLKCWELLRGQGGNEAVSSETASSAAEPSIHELRQKSPSALRMSSSVLR